MSENKGIANYFREYSFELTKEQEEQLYTYYKYLVETNKVMNLTAITEYEEVVIKHFIDSATIKLLDIDLNYKKIVDVGTGAGFPGMVLAILYPKSEVYLVDSLNKRIKFLDKLKEKIGLDNVRCFHSRGEDFAKKYPQTFDIGVSRAVAKMQKLGDYILPLIKKGGVFIAYKGIFDDNEEKEGLKTLKKYKASYEEIKRFNLTGEENKRALVKIRL